MHEAISVTQSGKILFSMYVYLEVSEITHNFFPADGHGWPEYDYTYFANWSGIVPPSYYVTSIQEETKIWFQTDLWKSKTGFELSYYQISVGGMYCHSSKSMPVEVNTSILHDVICLMICFWEHEVLIP